MAAKKKNEDIRPSLPVAVKGGTASKPVWTIGNECFEFKGSLTKTGLNKEGRKPVIGSHMTIAKYDAGQTTKGAPLWFVGVYRKVKGAAPAAPAATDAAPEVLETAPVAEVPVEGQVPVEVNA